MRDGPMPTSVSRQRGRFDRFADMATRMVSRAWFFAACVLMIVVWLPSLALFRDVDTWQLVINTATTCVTFLLVALRQNAHQRGDQATQRKLNAIAAGLLFVFDEGSPVDEERVAVVRRELAAAVGLEEHESA